MGHIVRAIFRGQNESCGYDKNKEYTLEIGQSNNEKHICIHIANGWGTKEEINRSRVAYDTINGFLNNWDNIRKI